MPTSYAIGPMVKQWKSYDYDGLLFGISAPGTTQPQLTSCVTIAVAAANAAVDLADLRVYGRDPWQGTRGPLVSLAWCDTREGLVLWLDLFCSSLDAQGITAKLAPATLRYPPTMAADGQKAALSAMISLKGWTPDDQGSATPVWVSDPTFRDRLLDWALAWVAGRSDSIYVYGNFNSQVLQVDAAREFTSSWSHLALALNPDVDHLRWVSLGDGGRLIVQIRDTETPWQDKLAALRDVLEVFANDSVYAGVRVAQGGALTAANVRAPAYRYPPLAPHRDPAHDAYSYYLHRRGFDDQRTPDAYGLQLLTDDHLARANDLSRWRIRPLAGGLHLVEADDLAAWYAQDIPDQDLVDAAREDFGDNLIVWDDRELR